MYGSSSTSRTGLAGCCVWTELYSRVHGWSRGNVCKRKTKQKGIRTSNDEMLVFQLRKNLDIWNQKKKECNE